ncbi:MAG TPA: DUF3037 domain-containing protein [Kofleriaceae bacterium]|nr:DUF3037 domain-containing protein [Kofleriaceae bacterium]
MASPFDYAVIRVVPRIEREEFVNAGVIVFARTLDYLRCACALDEARVLALDPTADLAAIRRHLAGISAVCDGAAAAGPIGRLPRPDRFHWLTTPRSTLLQPSPVHAGMTDDPAATLAHLVEKLVR